MCVSVISMNPHHSIYFCQFRSSRIVTKWCARTFKNSLSKIITETSLFSSKSDFKVNYELPKWLDKNTNCRIVHPGTDCELDSDAYGMSKKDASLYLLQDGRRTKIIQTSIIGPELHSKAGLFEWFINSTGSVSGWTENMWNGNTTLQWAKICYDMLISWEEYPALTVPTTECISKFEILRLIKGVFNKEIDIIPENNGSINKCLPGTSIPGSLKRQLVELKEFMENS